MIDYIILGVIQGIFEWIPISSQGIVALISQFLIQEINPVDVALFLHLGTLLAALIYFRRDWQAVVTFKNVKMLRFLIIATIFSLVVGFPIYKLVRDLAVGNTLLLIMGFGLLITAYFQKKEKKLPLSFDSLAIISGFFQGLSIIPGLSRSGSTIFSLSLGNLKPSEVLKISYMMSVPVVLVSNSYIFLNNPVLLLESWPGLIFSFLVGLGSLHFLITISQRINFFRFALFFGLICILGAIAGFFL